MQTIIANKGVRAVLLTKKCIYANDFDVHDVVTKSSALMMITMQSGNYSLFFDAIIINLLSFYIRLITCWIRFFKNQLFLNAGYCNILMKLMKMILKTVTVLTF